MDDLRGLELKPVARGKVAQIKTASGAAPALRVDRHQFLESRLDTGFFIEVAVPGTLRELQLFDRGGKIPAQHIGFGLGAVQQQTLSECGISARLQFV